MEFNPPKKINVKLIPKKGLGVFATKKIKKGEVVEECPVFSLGDDESPISVSFFYYRFSYPKERGSKESVIPWGYGSLYNHDKTPNTDWRDHPEYMGFEFYSLSDIEVGEELTISYGGENYWKVRDDVDLVFNEPKIKKLFFCINDNDKSVYGIEDDVTIIKISSNPHDFDKYKITQIPTLLMVDEGGCEIERVTY